MGDTCREREGIGKLLHSVWFGTSYCISSITPLTGTIDEIDGDLKELRIWEYNISYLAIAFYLSAHSNMISITKKLSVLK
jgi:hypothetical protein